MRIKVTALVNLRIWLVDWKALEPYWAKSWQYESLRDEKLAGAFLTNWFSTKNGERVFHVGHLDYFPTEPRIMFSNGSHRTRLLAQHLRYVPVSAHASCYRSPTLAAHFKRRLSREQPIDFPDLPVLDYATLRALPV